jgi:hypothetical protein
LKRSDPRRPVASCRRDEAAPVARVAGFQFPRAALEAWNGRNDPKLARRRRAALSAAAPTPQEITAIAEQVRHRVLRWFACSGLRDTNDARDMPGWDNGGFSLDASVRIARQHRAEVERLLRCRAGQPFAQDRPELVNAHRVIYRLPNPDAMGAPLCPSPRWS